VLAPGVNVGFIATTLILAVNVGVIATHCDYLSLITVFDAFVPPPYHYAMIIAVITPTSSTNSAFPVALVLTMQVVPHPP
jgi:hypothetical protein